MWALLLRVVQFFSFKSRRPYLRILIRIRELRVWRVISVKDTSMNNFNFAKSLSKLLIGLSSGFWRAQTKRRHLTICQTKNFVIRKSWFQQILTLSTIGNRSFPKREFNCCCFYLISKQYVKAEIIIVVDRNLGQPVGKKIK